MAAWALRETPLDLQRKWFKADDREMLLEETTKAAVKFGRKNLAVDDPDLWQPGAYDVIFSSVYPLTSKLTQEFLGAPLDPSLGMRFGIDNFAIGIGDLLIFALFAVATYKAYGRPAARLAFGLIVVFGALVPSLVPLVINFIVRPERLLLRVEEFFAGVLPAHCAAVT